MGNKKDKKRFKFYFEDSEEKLNKKVKPYKRPRDNFKNYLKDFSLNEEIESDE